MQPAWIDALSPEEREIYMSIQSRFIDHLTLRLKELKICATYVDQLACLHRLSGASSSYGFTDISDMSMTLEAQCQKNQTLISVDDLAALSRLVEDTRAGYYNKAAYGN